MVGVLGLFVLFYFNFNFILTLWYVYTCIVVCLVAYYGIRYSTVWEEIRTVPLLVVCCGSLAGR